MDYRNNSTVVWFDRPMRSGQTVMRTDDAT